jgi:hypothetical protein
LQALHDTGTHDPDFGGGAGLFTKVETELEETGSRGDGIGPGGNTSNDETGSEEDATDRWETDQSECAPESVYQLCSIAKVATTHASQGRDRTQTEGSILKMVYQATVETTKTEQTMYKSTSLSVLEPPSKLNWNDVYRSASFHTHSIDDLQQRGAAPWQ